MITLKEKFQAHVDELGMRAESGVDGEPLRVDTSAILSATKATGWVTTMSAPVLTILLQSHPCFCTALGLYFILHMVLNAPKSANWACEVSPATT